MLLEPRMVGRALHGEIERDFHLVLLAGGDEIAKILQRAKFGVHRIVTAIACFNSSLKSGAGSPVCRKSSHLFKITVVAACPPASALVSMPAPSIASRVTSAPAFCFSSKPRRQVANSSVQASRA